MKMLDYMNALPDSYRKHSASNNYKLLQLEQSSVQGLRDDIRAVDETLDIYSATGVTLDLYGSMYGQSRGSLTDDQYRYVILQKVAANSTDTDYNTIVSRISVAFDVDPRLFQLVETSNPAEVELLNMPYIVMLRAGVTSSQMQAIIKSMLPVGVKLTRLELEGTFEFADTADEYDEAKGFGNIEQTIGGYFGTLAEDNIAIP